MLKQTNMRTKAMNGRHMPNATEYSLLLHRQHVGIVASSIWRTVIPPPLIAARAPMAANIYNSLVAYTPVKSINIVLMQETKEKMLIKQATVERAATTREDVTSVVEMSRRRHCAKTVQRDDTRAPYMTDATREPSQ